MSDRKTRVWQYIQKIEGDKPPKLVTYQRDRGQVNGTTFPAAFRQTIANDCHQFVVKITEQYYDDMCKAMERYAVKYGLVELSESDIGKIPVKLVFRPKEEPEVASLRQENERLKSILAASQEGKK